MDSRNIKFDHSYVRAHPRPLSYLEIEHNYVKQTSKPFLGVTSVGRKLCQIKYNKLQQRTPSEAELASRLYIASDHAYAKSPPTLLHNYPESVESKNINLDIVKLAQTEKVIQTLKSV